MNHPNGRLPAVSLKLILLLLVSACPSHGAGNTGKADVSASKVITAEHLAAITKLSSPQLSPDGKSIAVLITRAHTESNTWDTVLELVEVATGKPRNLTPGRTGVAHPRWSPSGDRLAFLSVPGGAGKEAVPQIFCLPMNGGEALQVTKSPTGVQHFSWSPDGNEIAFAAEDERPNKQEIEKGNDAFEITNDDIFTTAEPLPVHIWWVPAGGGAARRLTSGTWTLPVSLPPSPPASPLSWSPDGREIAFTRQETAHTGDQDKASIQILNVASGALRAVTGQVLFEGFPVFSPDGKSIAYWQYRDRDPGNVNDILLAPATGGPGRNLTLSVDRCLYQNRWLPDGKSLLVGANDGDKVCLWEVPLEGQPRKLDLGDLSPAWSFWIDVSVGKKGEIVFPGSSAEQPAELYYCESATAKPRRLTDYNARIAALDLGKVETVTWDGPDGFKENGLLFYPPGYRAGTRLPLVLNIHGGPQAASVRSFSAFNQLMATHGYLVFCPNYRGSDNLGNAYQHAIFNDAGDGPGRDVMSGIEALKARGIVDESRIAVTGWSYGGYMTSWLIGHHDFWKAAVAGAAVTDLTDEYCFSDGNVTWKYAMQKNAAPWSAEGQKLYREQSPISYAAHMKTPTLIITDTGDARVPPSQSWKLYHALKDQGATVSMVGYPVPGHFPGDPVRSKDCYQRWLSWLDRYLGAEPAKP